MMIMMMKLMMMMMIMMTMIDDDRVGLECMTSHGSRKMKTATLCFMKGRVEDNLEYTHFDLG